MYRIIGADQKEYGPISAEQIRQWIAEGRINGQTRVMPEGGAAWTYVANVPELASALPSMPAPIALTVTRPPRNSSMAIWAMVTGILSLVCCQFLAPLPIVLGAVALSNMKQNPEMTGRGFAITGIVLGVVALILTVVAVVVFMSDPQLWQTFQKSMQQQ